MATATQPSTAEVLPPRRDPALVAVLPGFLTLATGLVLGAVDGGFPTHVWAPAGLFLLALVVVVTIVAPPAPRESSLLFNGALGLFLAFVAWSFCSIAWADAPGDAWTGANRTLLYGLVLLLVGLRPWPVDAMRWALGLVGFGGALLAFGTLLSGTGGDAADLFLEGRLAEPTQYANATADLWLIAFWPALHLATVRSVPWPVRGAALAAATILAETALLSQSRGAVIAFCATALLYVAVTTRRWPALLALGSVVALGALSWDPLIDVRDSDTPADLGPALADARRVIGLSALVALVAGAAVALAGQGVAGRLGERRGTLARAGDWALVGLGVAGLVAVLVAIGSPTKWLDDRWEDFKTSGYTEVERDRTRFGGSLGSNRYDFYRVSLNEFREHPVAGIGADNFSIPYLQHRRSGEAPRYPHSFAMRTLAGLGAVGALLFLGFLALAVAGVVRVRRAVGTEAGGLAVAALCGFAMWFFHGLVDWLWEFPALGVLAFGLLAVAVRAQRPGDGSLSPLAPEPVPWAPPPSMLDSWPVRAGLTVLALGVALSLALPGIASRYTNAAYRDYTADPGRALTRLERAASLDFLAPEPLVAKGVIARRLGRTSLARSALRRAIEREPDDWFAHFELGLLELEAGRSALARGSVERAARLNPRQPLVRFVAARARAGEQIDATAVERRLYQQLGTKLRPTG